MRLLSPVALAWLLLVPVLILLYMRRRAQNRRAVSNLFLWRSAASEFQIRPRLNRLVTNPLLLCQIAFVAAATLALAGPVMSCGGGRRVAIVIDTSASMQAHAGGRSRLDEARGAALDRLDRAGAAALISAGESPVLEQPMTPDLASLRTALGALAAGSGGSNLEAAVSLAWSAIDPPPDRVIVITDGTAVGPAGSSRGAVEMVRVGGPAANVAITRLALRRHPGSSFDGQVLAMVANFGGAAVRAPFTLVQDGHELRAETLTLTPGERRAIVVDTDDAASPVRARIEIADALAADNEAVADAVAPPARVAVVGDASSYLRAALSANPLVSLVSSAADADVVVCNRCAAAPRGAPLLTLQRGGSMSRLTAADPDHPVLAFADFDGVRAAATPLVTSPHERVLVTADGAAVVSASEEGGVRAIRAGLDATQGGLAATAAFPIFVANAVEWLRGDSPGGDARTIPSAESDLRPQRADAPAAAGTDRGAVAGTLGEVRLWRAGVAIALGILALLSVRFETAKARTPLRVATAMVLAAALAGIEVAAGAARRHVVFVLDVSGSIAAAERTRAARLVSSFLAGTEPGDEASLVTFGAAPLVEARRARHVDASSLASRTDAHGTDISAALRLAGTLASPDGRVVLISDGNETHGDARAEASRAAADGVAIDVVMPPSDLAARPDVLVAALHAPPGVAARQPFEVVAEVAATVPQRATVRLLRAGAIAAEQQVALERGTRRVAFPQRSVRGGLVRYDVEVLGERDAVAANNHASALVNVGGPARVLYVSQSRAASGAALLGAHGFDVVRERAAGIPAAAALSAFDAVVLDDVPASDVSAAQREALARYVEQEGGGLVMTGVRSFGPGGWAGTRIEGLAPVDMRPPGRRDASGAALVLVLDKSGSMAEVENGARKIDIAIRAAAPLVDLFAASRTIGVLAFDTAVVPLVRLGDDEPAASMLERMRALTAGGGTAIAPAVAAARRWLEASRARRRHIVLLSDGRSSPADRAALLEGAGAGGITVSTVGVGDAVDRAVLGAVAARGAGRAYFPGTLSELPGIFMQEATLAAGMWRVEERFTPQAEAPHAVLRDVDMRALGTVGGYVATTSKTSADVILASHRRDPLLAGWERGLGRAAALTTDLQAAWSDSLRASPAFAQVWAQTVRWAARPRETDRLHPAIVVRGTAVTIAAGAFTRDAGFFNGLDMHASIEVDGGTRRDVPMTQTAPGRYEADPIELPAGFHIVRISAAGGRAPYGVITGVHVAAAPEYARAGPDVALLADVARLSGGDVLAATGSPFARAAASRRTIETRTFLIGLALLLFTADVAIARGVLRRRRQAAA